MEEGLAPGLLSFCLLFGSFVTVLNGFNLDTSVPIVKVGPTDSYFGFSIAEHQIYRDQDVEGSDPVRVLDRSV